MTLKKGLSSVRSETPMVPRAPEASPDAEDESVFFSQAARRPQARNSRKYRCILGGWGRRRTMRPPLAKVNLKVTAGIPLMKHGEGIGLADERRVQVEEEVEAAVGRGLVDVAGHDEVGGVVIAFALDQAR